MAKGYKLHAIVDLSGRPLAWRLASLKVAETKIAKRLVREMPPCAYLIGDTGYDSNALFAHAASKGIQLIVPRRHGGPGRKLGHIKQHPSRIRSMAITENMQSPFAMELLRTRRTVERFFASLVNFGGGLTCLPSWVRTYPRVHAWVQIKLLIALTKPAINQSNPRSRPA
jgi:transposase